jgi:hypothetical protein
VIAQTATTISQETRCRDTLAIVAKVPDSDPKAVPSAADAEVAVARLTSMSADLRGCVILDRDGEALAASGPLDGWAEAGRAMLAAADAAAGEPVAHAHVGTEDGEAFAVRHDGFAVVAAAERFTLAGLLLFDIRAVLRELAGVLA